MKVFSFVVGLALTLNVALAQALAQPNEQIEQARVLLDGAQRQLDNNAADINARSGLSAMLNARLRSHVAQLNSADPETMLRLAELDAALIDQLAQQTYMTLGAIHGASPALLPAIGEQKRPYLLAVYVPPGLPADKPAPLILYLHGKGQSEADVIATPLVRSLADATGSIVIAPYAGGDDMLANANIADLYQALAQIESAMRVDQHRIYLVGNSLGGFAAFKAIAKAPDRWSSMLVIEGAVAETDNAAVAAHVRGKSIYLVAGGGDQSVTSVYIRQLATWLRSNGALVTYYEQPDGIHSLDSVAPMASKAWRDMLAGVRPTSGAQDGAPTAPSPHPSQPS